MGDNVAPCFGNCSMISIYTIRDGRLAKRMDFPLRSRDPFDRVRLLRDQEVETIICGGVQDLLEAILQASGITVISWVSGSMDDLLDLYIRGQLVPCRERPDPHFPLPTHCDEVH
jgi:predicted Fe-Mo cluster-binding NifX family protein